MRGRTEWHLPLLDLDILVACQVRGYRFDLIYYDEEIDATIIEDIFYSCCGGRPRPLKELLWRLNVK